MNSSEDPLDTLLQEWQVHAEPPRSLQREVWARIAAGEADLAWWEVLLRGFLKPRALALGSAAAIFLGAGLAYLETRPLRMDPHQAYVQSISPFVSMHLASH